MHHLQSAINVSSEPLCERVIFPTIDQLGHFPYLSRAATASFTQVFSSLPLCLPNCSSLFPRRCLNIQRGECSSNSSVHRRIDGVTGVHRSILSSCNTTTSTSLLLHNGCCCCGRRHCQMPAPGESIERARASIPTDRPEEDKGNNAAAASAAGTKEADCCQKDEELQQQQTAKVGNR